VMAIWLGIMQAYCCALTLATPLDKCHIKSYIGSMIGIHHWLIGQIVFAALHIVFGPYFQCRLWNKMTEKEEMDMPTTTGPTTISGKNVKESFRDVLSHDIGVAVYLFLFVCSFFWSWLGKDLTEGAFCNPGHNASWGASLGVFFCWSVVLYCLGWWVYVHFMADDDGIRVRGGVSNDYHQPEEQPQQPPQPTGLVQKIAGVFGAAPAPPPPPPPPPPKKRNHCLAGSKLMLAVTIDVLGNLSYLIPVLGEAGDVAFAPMQGVAAKMMYDANALALFALAEELLPGFDLIPTMTVGWVLETFFPKSYPARLVGMPQD